MRLNKTATKLAGRSLYPLLSLTIPLLLYTAVLVIGVPNEVGLAARYGFTTVLIAIALLLYPAYRLSGWTGTLASLSVTLILFALPLSGLWNNAVSAEFTIGGLLPWSDASGYYWDAKRLLEGGTFSYFSSRRPLFTGMLAVLLGLTQQNLQVTVAILVAVTTISCFLAAREVQRSHGIAAGLLVITILFLFYRRYIGWTSTEHLGLALGAVGFATLWRGAGQRQINHCLLGLLLLTLALSARAGAFFILPAIILWGAWSFRGAARVSWRFLLGGASVVLLGFILNSLLLKIIGSPDGESFSNFSYTLYGLIVGGNWTQVMADHPELKALGEPELSRKIYALAFEVLRANPLGLVNGLIRAWKQFLFEDYIFSFISNLKTNFVLQILSLVALLACYHQRREPNASLIIVATLGILASVPFAPPWDADTMRVYAATIPFTATLPALGLEFIISNKLKSPPSVQVQTPEKYSAYLFIFSLTFAVFVFVAPIATKVFSRAPQFANISCPAGTTATYLRISSGAFINLVADNSIPKTHLPDVRLSDFRKGMLLVPSYIEPDIVKELTSLSASNTLINMFNFNDLDAPNWLIAKSTMIPKHKGIVGVCGEWANNPIPAKYRFFYANSVQSVSTIGNK
jgi:hypothetical protein